MPLRRGPADHCRACSAAGKRRNGCPFRVENDSGGVQSKKKNPSERRKLPEVQMDMQFFRIGREYFIRKERLQSNHWFSVGSGTDADVSLDPEDRKLGQRHFRINISGSVLLVAALEGETFVNGVPIRKLGTVQAYSGDLIRAGSHEYRVIFAPSEEKENAT